MAQRLVQFADNLWHPILDTPKGGSPYVATSICGLEMMFSGAYLSNAPYGRWCPACREKTDAAKAEAPITKPRVVRRRRAAK